MDNNIPKLKSYVGSWAIIKIETGECMIEIFKGDKRVNHLDFNRFKLVPMDEYLAGLTDNKVIKV